MNRKSLLVDSLNKIVTPELRKNGFIGEFPEFRRNEKGRLSFIDFQFNKSGGSLCVNIGKSDDIVLSLLPNLDYRQFPFEKLTTSCLRSSSRRRLKQKPKLFRFYLWKLSYDWFVYKRLSTKMEFDLLAVEIKDLLPEAESYFKSDYDRNVPYEK